MYQEKVVESKSTYGIYLLREIIKSLIAPKDYTYIMPPEITSIEEAITALVFDFKNLRDGSLNLIKKEVSRGKIIWGSVTPYIPLFHHVTFYKKDKEATEALFDLFKSTLERNYKLSHIDRILLTITIKAYQYYKNIKSIISNEMASNKEIERNRKIHEVLKTVVRNAVEDINRTAEPSSDLIICLVKEVLIAELGWNNLEQLNEVIGKYLEFKGMLVDDQEILDGFMIIRNNSQDIVMEYFYRKAEKLRNDLSRKTAKCQYLKDQKAELIRSKEKWVNTVAEFHIRHKFIYAFLLTVLSFITILLYVGGEISGTAITGLITVFLVINNLLKRIHSIGIDLIGSGVEWFFNRRILKIEKKIQKECTIVDVNKYFPL